MANEACSLPDHRVPMISRRDLLDLRDHVVFRQRVDEALDGRAADGGRTAPTAFGSGAPDLEAGRAFLAAMADVGLATPTWPVEVGGLAASSWQVTAIRRAMNERNVPDLYPYVVGLGIVGPTIASFGSDEQKSRLLPATQRGDAIWCQLFSEPGAGSDLAGVETRARRTGSGWVLDGAKVWSSRAEYATHGLCLARTDPAVPKHKGLSMFAIDMSQSGVAVTPIRQINGEAHFNEVRLDSVAVEHRDLIGAAGQGWRVAIAALAHERTALPVNNAPKPLATLARLAELGRRSSVVQAEVLRDRLTQLWVDVQVSRWATGRDHRKDPDELRLGGPASKLRHVRIERQMADLGAELLGICGVSEDHEWEQRLLVGPSLSIRGGTDEVLHNVLGERVLGLPPEPRVDAGPFRAAGAERLADAEESERAD